MSEKIKLSELRAARAAMPMGTERAAVYECLNGEIEIRCPRGGGCVLQALEAADAAGIVASHNAVDALIELAEADLAYRKVRRANGMAAIAKARLDAARARLEP